MAKRPVNIDRLKWRLLSVQQHIWNLDEELQTVTPMAGITWEQCPRWARLIMSMCQLDGPKAWYNHVLRNRLLAEQQYRKLRKQIRDFEQSNNN